jgi:hypothetical protein
MLHSFSIHVLFSSFLKFPLLLLQIPLNLFVLMLCLV